MKSWKILLLVTVVLMVSGQAAAQADDREADVERRMYDAEQRMAEAARQIAELTAERLPQLESIQRQFEFISDDRPRLGVTIGGEEEGQVEGVSILGVTPGSAAEEAGLRAGDLITSVNGESMSADGSDAATNRLLDFMRGVEEGDMLQIEYLRDGKTGTVEVEPRPVAAQGFAFGGHRRGFRMPGAPGARHAPGIVDGPSHFVLRWNSNGWGDMELVELNAGLGKYFGTDNGLLVVNAPGSKSLQLEDGDVIQKIDGRVPTSVRHALRILGSYQSGETLQLEIMRDKKRRTLEVAVPEDLNSGVKPPLAPVMRPSAAPSPVRPNTPVEKT